MHGQIYILIGILLGLLIQVLGLAWAVLRVVLRRGHSPARTMDRILFFLCTLIFLIGGLAMALFLIGQINRGDTLYPLLIALLVSTAGWVAHRWCFKRLATERT